MPIELWWWVEPLFDTGFLTIMLAAVIAHLVDKNTSSTVIPAIVAAIGIAPWIICGCSVLVWFVTNVLIIIWR